MLPIDKSSPSTQSGYSPSTKARFSWNIVRVFCILHNNRNAMHFRPPFLEIDKFFQKVRQVTRPEEISSVRGGKRHWLSETKTSFQNNLVQRKNINFSVLSLMLVQTLFTSLAKNHQKAENLKIQSEQYCWGGGGGEKKAKLKTLLTFCRRVGTSCSVFWAY